MKTSFWVAAFLASTLAGLPCIAAPDVRGAEAILQSLAAEASGKTTADDPAAAASGSLKAELEAFKGGWRTMSPEDAAAGWLALVDRSLQGPVPMMDPYAYMQRSAGHEAGFAGAVHALPGPQAWPAIAAALEARDIPEDAALREHALRAFVHFLVRDMAKMEAHLAAILALRDTMGEEEAQYLGASIERLAETLGALQRDPASVRQAFERRIEAARRAPHEAYNFAVPNLVELFGEAETEKLLESAVTLPIDDIDWSEAGEETVALARKVALRNVDTLGSPRWELVQDTEGAELFEAMQRKFVPEAAEAPKEDAAAAPAAPAAGGSGMFSRLRELIGDDVEEDEVESVTDSYEYREAHGQYVLALLLRGRDADAAAALRRAGDEFSLPYEALETLDEAGRDDEAEAVLREALTAKPSLGLWNEYATLATSHGRVDELIATASAAERQPRLSLEQRIAIRDAMISALLAVDRVDEAAALLIEGLEIANGSTVDALAFRLAKLGVLLDRAEWRDAGFARLLDEDKGTAAAADPDSVRAMMRLVERHAYPPADTVALLVEAGRVEDAEEFVRTQLAAGIRQAEQRQQHLGPRSDGRAAKLLAQLAGLYHELGRHDDVVRLLDEAPYWGEADLADVIDEGATPTKRLAPVAAAALAATGRRDDAVAVLEAHLAAEGSGHDASYAAYVDLLGLDAIPRLDALFARDRFEERPLIWKAVALLRAKRNDEALATIRQAVATDPSDGEQGQGDRLRAYAVLADALEATGGDAEEIAKFRGAVAAVRLSERADRFYEAGLAQRSIAMYEEALGLFVDAYCIQWRLAKRLTEQGRLDEGAEHFRKAYELMPSSFGRIESYCFGCEGVFSTGQSKGIAEQVLEQLARERPDSAQVQYFTGYFYSSSDQEAKALPHLLRAVEIDPDYLSAWKLLQSDAAIVDPNDHELQDRAAINLIRLDPLTRHSYDTTRGVWDLAGLWRAAEANVELVPPAPELEYRLEASAAKLARDKAARDPRMGMHYDYEDFNPSARNRKRPATPGELLAQHEVTQAVASLIQH